LFLISIFYCVGTKGKTEKKYLLIFWDVGFAVNSITVIRNNLLMIWISQLTLKLPSILSASRRNIKGFLESILYFRALDPVKLYTTKKKLCINSDIVQTFVKRKLVKLLLVECKTKNKKLLNSEVLLSGGNIWTNFWLYQKYTTLINNFDNWINLSYFVIFWFSPFQKTNGRQRPRGKKVKTWTKRS